MNLLLYFFGSPPRPLGDDFDVVIRYVWIGLDRQIMKRDATPDEEQNRQGKDHEPVV